MRWRTAGALAGLLLTVPHLASAADPPAWLEQASRLPGTPGATGAIVLVDEVHVTVAEDGRVTTRRQYAVRVSGASGAGAAAIREIYGTDSGSVRTLRGWVLSDGRSLELGRAETIDHALVDNDVYNESRVRVLAARATLPTGAVFGAESEVVERGVFTQLEWTLQQEWPVRSARRQLTLPPGWNARSVTFNHAPVEPVRTGQSFAWTLDNLAAFSEEPAGPPPSSLMPRIAVTYRPAGPSVLAFDDWQAVSRWLSGLVEPRGTATPPLIARARELTASSATELDRIRAIGRYAQGIQYISIQTGLGRGGGYTPHAAADVFTKNYGDCKDKANLMRTMLASIGIQAHVVAIYSGDRTYVRPEWPSPQQFNHAIVAVAVGAETRGPAVQELPGLGRLLFFDPTDEVTPVGELPTHLQGSPALIIHPQGAPLTTMPDSAPEANPISRHIDAALSLDGTLRATLRRSTAGGPAADDRSVFRGLQKDEYLRLMEAEVRRQVPGASMTLGDIGDDTVTNRFDLTMTIQAAAYAQAVQGRLMIVRPPQAQRRDLPVFPPAARQAPVLLEPRDEQDRLELVLPPGVVVDEMPPAAARQAPFGSFSVRWQVENGRVVRTVSLKLQRSAVPPDGYAALSAFFGAFRDAEQSPVVLVRQ